MRVSRNQVTLLSVAIVAFFACTSVQAVEVKAVDNQTQFSNLEKVHAITEATPISNLKVLRSDAITATRGVYMRPVSKPADKADMRITNAVLAYTDAIWHARNERHRQDLLA
jgi:hypothetical protein